MVEIPQVEKEMIMNNEHIKDVEELSATELKAKYGPTYKSWSNMKQRKSSGAIIDPRFDQFTDFLVHMGPRPSKDYTIDRINNEDRTYSPENCRWADKHTQNSNKGNNVYITYEGETHTIAQWAKIKGENASTLYKRKEAGWTDEEIVTGAREVPISDPWKETPWPEEDREKWEKWYQSAIFKGAEYTRLDFMVAVCEQEFGEIDRILKDECGQSLDPETGEPTDAHWEKVRKREYFSELYEKAVLLQQYQKNRTAFIARSRSIHKVHEAALFDLLNPAPQYLNEP